MPDDTPLTDLCSICYTDQPKYRCPRCKTRTCSLACSQKHKQRASCNGVRDPAEYFKRSQLATPVGIDRDYNYLKSVERDIEVASRGTKERGVGVSAKDAPKAVSRARHPESALQKYLVNERIHVQRAPIGMSRQKENQTRVTKHKTILWTLECIDAEGRQLKSHRAEAKRTIRELWSFVQTENANAIKREVEGNSDVRIKRKRAEAAHSAKKVARSEEIAKLKAAGVIEEIIIPGDEPDDDNEKASTVPANEDNEAPQNQPSVDSGQGEAKGKPSDLHYYLLRPGTSSAAKVLIPLDPGATLTSCLQDRTVLEYPTIYGLPLGPDDLPSKFLTEEAYLKMQKGEEKELKDAMLQVGSVSTAQGQSSDSATTNMDPQRILDMLKRDVTR